MVKKIATALIGKASTEVVVDQQLGIDVQRNKDHHISSNCCLAAFASAMVEVLTHLDEKSKALQAQFRAPASHNPLSLQS
jgi:hypothetical protein